MEPHPFTDLGGLDKPEDKRDIQLGAVTSPTYTFPKVLRNDTAWDMPVEYQGQQPACGAHSGGALCGILDDSRYSPRFTWADIKTFDGNAIEAGTDMRSIFKSLTKTGPLDFPLMGNDVNMSLLKYATPAITAAMRLNAGKHKAPGYGFWTDRSFNGLKQYISDHGAVVILMRVNERFWKDKNGNNSWREKDILPLALPSAQFPVVSGHFIVGHSYDEKRVYFLNSFSDEWGKDGHGYFEANFMSQINDVGTLIGLALTKNLSIGMVDPEVKELQKILNKNPKTQVALQGAGSPGEETENFGPLTLAAVIKFQKLYAIQPAVGFVGPLTRAVLNVV